MDKLSELSNGAKIVLGAAVAFLIVSLFNWQEVDLGPVEAGVSGWDGIGFIGGLLAIALIVWLGLRIAGVKVEIGVSASMITAALAALLLLITIIKFISDNEFRTFWAWLGLLLAIVAVAGAWLNMQSAGESLADVREKVQEMTGSGGSEAAAPPAAPPTAAPPAPATPADAPEAAGEDARPDDRPA